MPSQNSTRGISGRLIASAILCVFLAFVAGCHRHTVMAAPPVSTAPATTEPQPPATPPVETKPEPAPETPPVTPPAPTTPAPAPPAPRPAPHKTEKTDPVPERPPAPLISPQLSPKDRAALERRTNEKIAEAEKNLQLAYGRELNAAQHDLVEKINNFLGQSREALRASDWTRAYNLAQKAYLLSVDFANSF
jgi:hypothetical protein